MPRQEAFQGSLPLLVLKVLARRGPLHGYGVTARIQEISEDVLRVEEGSLYPALHRMEARGLIEAEWGLSENNRKAKFYRLTARGRRELRTEAESWSRYVSVIGKVMAASEQPA